MGLRLTFLGGFEAALDGKPITGFISSKAQAVLCYLAVDGRTHSRHALATMFWSDMPDKEAMTNLRQVLSNLRKLAGDHVTITRQTAVFNRYNSYWLDVAVFVASSEWRVASGDSSPAARHSPLVRLEEIAALYRGDFLAGFHVRNAPDFEAWARLQQEWMREHALDIFGRLTTQQIAQGAYKRALASLARQLEMEPWREEAHRQRMWLLAKTGQRNAALHQYDVCRHILRQELAVEPAQETTLLYNRVRAARKRPFFPQPHPVASFIGREQELAEIGRLLRGTAYQLISIVGLGGMGKTRLAQEAVRGWPHLFLDGSFFVRLAAVESEAGVITAVARAIGLHFYGRSPRRQQLITHLRDQETLLVLDNIEQLVAGDGTAIIPLLIDLLEQAPQLKLLITSRQRLNLRQEWVLPLDGLAVEDNADVLFVERARQHGAVHVGDAPSVSRICHLLGGSPLGIELVAGLTAQQSCAAIAQQLTQDLDAAAASWRDVIPRHRSLRVVFEQSWRLLPATLRATLARLSLFHGRFSAAAALRVSGAVASDLRLLADRSLLVVDNGRFDLHPVIQQFTQGKLEAMGEMAAIWAAYGGYYADFLQQRESVAHTPLMLAEIDGEWSNIAAAWGWMMSEGVVTAVNQSIIPLFTFLETRARYQEGVSMMGEAVNMLAAITDNPEARLAYGRALMFSGVFIGCMGRFKEALAEHKRSFHVLQSLPHEPEMARSLIYHALNLQDVGRYDEAETYCQRGLTLYQKLNDKSGIASAIKTLGHIDYNSGRWKQARRYYEQTAVLYEELGNQRESSAMLLNLGNIAYEQGAYTEAKARYSESLLFKEAVGDLSGIARATHNLGLTALALKEYDEARRFSNRSIQISSSINARQVTTVSYELLGDVALAQNEHEAARTAFRQALALAREGQYEVLSVKVLEKLAALGGE